MNFINKKQFIHIMQRAGRKMPPRRIDPHKITIHNGKYCPLKKILGKLPL